MTTEQEIARIAELEKNIRQGETKLARWWAKRKWWHSPSMTERYFGSVENEFACIAPPRAGDPNEKLWQKAVDLQEHIEIRRRLRLRVHLSEVLQLELLTVRLFSDERLLAKVWSIRSDFKRIVPKETFEQYQASNPPSPSRNAEPSYIDKVREDAVDLQTGIHWWYTSSYHKEKRLYITKLKLFGSLSIFLIVTVLLAKCHMVAPSALLMLLIVALMGMMGAVLSIGRRMLPVSEQNVTDSDPVIRATQFDHGGIGLGLSTIVGGVSAVVLYLLMAAGLNTVAEPLTPKFMSVCLVYEACKPTLPPTLFNYFSGLLPFDTASFAKALCWSFVAGFAEQFVPDILDRMAKSDKANAK